jgi:hypothetical protein
MIVTTTSKKPSVRLLFLNNPETDRRTKNFIGLFGNLGYDVEAVFATPGIQTDETLMVSGISAQRLPLPYSSGWKMFLHYHKSLSLYLRTAKPCDILLACDLFSLKAAAHSKKTGNAGKLFYDARELYTELPSVAAYPLKKIFWKRWEYKGLKQTDQVIVTAPDDAQAIQNVHNFLPPSVLIRNFPKREELQPNNYLREYFSLSSEKKICVYIGGLQNDRGLEKMTDLMPLLQDSAVFVMIGDGTLKDRLELKCKEMNLEHCVYFHPAIASESAIMILSSADIGISLIEQHSKSYSLALPSKIFEYKLAGLPVISSPLKQVKDLMHKSEGMVFADPENRDDLFRAAGVAMSMSEDILLRTAIHVEAYNSYTFETDAEKLKQFLTQ